MQGLNVLFIPLLEVGPNAASFFKLEVFESCDLYDPIS